MQNVTTFQKRVYQACSRIPEGKVSTYKHLADAIGCGSPRAVGQALKKNPFAPEVPCHRVVKSDLGLGGFYGKTEGPEVARKRRMLTEEGVQFDPQGRVAEESVHFFREEALVRSSGRTAPQA